MKRRHYLAALSAGVLAGCSGSDGSETQQGTEPTETPTPTPNPTPEPTPTATPEPVSPSISETSLLYGWRDFGDVQDKQLEAVGKGAQAIVGFHYSAMVHDGTVNLTEQVSVYGPENNRVDIDQQTDEQLTDTEGVQEYEHAIAFDTATWDLGSYTYEVLIRDNVTSKVSDTIRGSFQVNSPLSDDEATLQSVDAPDSVNVGEDYSFTLEIGNTSNRDGSVVTSLSAKYESSRDWYTYTDDKLTVSIPSEWRNTWESAPVSFDTEGTLQYRLDAINEIWEIEVV
jgi:hypothetical protein